MKYVLDATAIRSGMSFAGDIWHTTPLVMDEIKLGKQARDLDMIAGLSIRVMEPDNESLENVKEVAAGTGDIDRLSETDVQVLALALELGAVIISNDYSVQNIAEILKIPYQTDFDGIREIVHWTYRCKGCGRYFEEKQVDCPVCGSEIRMVRKR